MVPFKLSTIDSRTEVLGTLAEACKSGGLKQNYIKDEATQNIKLTRKR